MIRLVAKFINFCLKQGQVLKASVASVHSVQFCCKSDIKSFLYLPRPVAIYLSSIVTGNHIINYKNNKGKLDPYFLFWSKQLPISYLFSLSTPTRACIVSYVSGPSN